MNCTTCSVHFLQLMLGSWTSTVSKGACRWTLGVDEQAVGQHRNLDWILDRR